MNAHLAQAIQQYEALTGTRGMELLLQGTVRNYLPTDVRALTGALAGAGAFSSNAQAFLNSNVVLTADQLAILSPEDRAHLQAFARIHRYPRGAYPTGAHKFQWEIRCYPAADKRDSSRDGPKGNHGPSGAHPGRARDAHHESTKLQVLFQAMTAKEQADRLRRREQVIADVGTRLEMAPLVFPANETLP